MFAGGQNGSTTYDIVDIYDVVAGTWLTPLTLSAPRVYMAALTVGNFSFFAG